MNTQYFQIKNFEKTKATHHRRVLKLKVNYQDVLDNDAWCTIETKVHKRLELWQQAGITVKIRSLATLINYETRVVIQNSLEWHGEPKSYDTAFYVKYYQKVNRGMTALLQNFIDRGEVK